MFIFFQIQILLKISKCTSIDVFASRKFFPFSFFWSGVILETEGQQNWSVKSYSIEPLPTIIFFICFLLEYMTADMVSPDLIHNLTYNLFYP